MEHSAAAKLGKSFPPPKMRLLADISFSEALEDLTGGIPSVFSPTNILDKNRFWVEELMNANKTFLFALSQLLGVHEERNGIYKGHCYSIMEARELDNFRLLKIRYENAPKVKNDNTIMDGSLSKHFGSSPRR